MVNLSNKERFLLEGEKYQQQRAIDKYNNYAIQAEDSSLKSLFSNLAKVEERHLEMINKLLNGSLPSLNSQYIHPYYESNISLYNNYFNVGNITLTSVDKSFKDGDKIICFEALTTEELLYSTYSSSFSEFKTTNLKNIFDTILKEKQENLKYLNDYMVTKGMYDNTVFF